MLLDSRLLDLSYATSHDAKLRKAAAAAQNKNKNKRGQRRERAEQRFVSFDLGLRLQLARLVGMCSVWTVEKG